MENTLHDDPLYEEVRQRIHTRYKRRILIAQSLISFFAVNVVVWVLWLFTDPVARVHPVLPLMISGISVVAVFSSLLETFSKELEERAIRREIAEERAWRLQMMDKNKNDDRDPVHLSDDGELVEEYVLDWEDDRQFKQD